MEKKMLTNGDLVLAKKTSYGLQAKMYANRKQAEASALKVGGHVIHRGRPFYVAFSWDGYARA